jgi:hypothetical protein
MWKDIENTNGFYSVSEDGLVKSNDRVIFNKGSNAYNKISGKILNQYKNNKGYLYVDLCIDGKSKHFLVHRLIAEAFIDNPEKYPIINHKDNNPLNNRVENLEWCTYAYNNQYRAKQNRNNYSEKCKKVREQPSVWLYRSVKQYDLNSNIIQTFNSLTQATNWLIENNYTSNKNAKSNIIACCTNKAKTAYGFIWRYVE